MVWAVCAALAWVAGCTTADHEQEHNVPAKALRDINEVKEAHAAELMSLPGVVGVYVGEREDHTPCVVVMVVKKTPELLRKIPATLEGHPVRVDETGEIRPMH